MSVKRALLIYLVVFVVALPLTFPAELAGRFITLPPEVQHSALKGSLMNIHIDWLQVGDYRVGDVQISPSLSGWFSGVPLKLKIEEPLTATAKAGGNAQSLQLQSVEAQASLAQVRQWLSLPGVGVDATVNLHIDEALMRSERCESLSGEITLNEFIGEGFTQLGELSGVLACENGSLVVTIEPDNALRLTGTATVTPQGRFLIDMTAEPPPGPLFELFTDFLGTPSNGRRFQIRFNS